MVSDSRQLIIDKYGVFLGKHSERLKVYLKGAVIEEKPFREFEHLIIVSGGITLSSDVIEGCAERGIPISFISWSGKPYAKLMSSEVVGTIKTRREQLMAYLDQRGVYLATAFTSGKVENQAVLLKYMAKYRKETDPRLFEKVRAVALELENYARKIQAVKAPAIDIARESILTLEAHAAKAYWEAANKLIIPDIDWKGRETRGAQDMVNSALNYGYGILYCQAERAVVLAGLDPYAGFLHADRSGKPSLVLDMVEEFRQMVVDKAIFGMLNKGTKIEISDGKLTEESRRAIAQKVNERMESNEPYEGKRHKLRTILQSQARHIATYVRGENPIYKAWVGRW
jgi:CRISPR-associated protein Cas1